MKKNGVNVFIKKLTMYLVVWLLTIAPTLSSNSGQDEPNPERIEGVGIRSANGTKRMVDFRNLAIFAGYWLETDCNATNN